MSSCTCSSSGAGQHQEGGAGGGAVLCHCGDQPPVQAEDPGVLVGGRPGKELDGPSQDAPLVQGEAGRRGVPLHGDRAVRGGLDGLRSALQRLPQAVPRGTAAGDQPLSRGH